MTVELIKREIEELYQFNTHEEILLFVEQKELEGFIIETLDNINGKCWMRKVIRQ